MKYMVKCGFCDKTFIVDATATDEDFICESCGGTNGRNNIVEEIIPKKSVVWRSGNKSEDDAWKAIKSFDVSEHEGEASALEYASEETKEKIGYWMALIPVGIILLLFMGIAFVLKFFLVLSL